MKFAQHKEKFLRVAVLLMLGMCVTVATSRAQEGGGRFKLPFVARWGNAVLPPGSYTYSFGASAHTYIINLRGRAASAFIMPAGYEFKTTADRSVLNVVQIGREHFIQSLELKEQGITLEYRTPKVRLQALGRPQFSRSHIRITAKDKGRAG